MKRSKRPATAHALARRRAGFALLEALVALLIGGFGLIAVARLQLAMVGESDFAKQLSEATFLGQRRLEDLRSFQRASAMSAADVAAGGWAYANIATGSQSVAGTNATYTVAWTITDGAATPAPQLKTATVNVSWTDARGTAQTATLHSIIASAEPSMSAGLSVPPAGTPIRRPKNRDLNVPVPAVDLGNGTSWFTPPGAASTVKLVFNNTTGVLTKRCNGAGTDPSTWSCANITAYLVSGFITVNSSNLTLSSPIDVGFTLTEGTLDGCYDDSALSTKTYAGRITYTCVVIGNDHDGNSATPARWSGASRLTGFTLGTTSSTNKVCRYSYDYDASGSITNYEHPATYTNASESLENQNFVIVRGNDSCPGSGVWASVQLQP